MDVGDFNHDGFADVVVPNFLNRSVSVLLGNGDGTFQSQQIHTTNLAPVQTVVSDINGDGRPDLVTVGNHDNSTGVLLSTGGGAVIVYHTIAITNGVPIFASEPQTYFVGTAPASVTVADINGDSIPDMLVANQGSSGTVTSLIGVGQGFFDDRQPQTLLNLGGAVDQPPTFPGDSGIGFAVTTSGSLVRFDLSNPSNGVQIVFAGSQLVAARALPSGQVVVAVLDFGSQEDDESGDGRGRMPWLSIRYPISDTSPLARFVIGLDEELIKRDTDARCGLMIIDLRSGDIVHWLRVDGMVTELYDVAVLPQVVRPKALGFKTDEIQRTISIGEPGSLV